MAVTGWGYVTLKLRVLGWIHALLMLGIAGVSGYYGLAVLGDRSIAGGNGPDANPVGGILYGIGFLYCVLAVATGVCGIGVIAHILDEKKDTKD